MESWSRRGVTKMSRISRRHFLRGIGGFTLSLPTLPSLLAPGKAFAQSTSVPKRFVAICNYDGYYESVYYPSVAADVQFAPDVFSKQLSTIGGPLSELLGPQFDPLRPKMNIYRGLDIPGSIGHSAANMLCGAARIVFGDTSPIDPVGNSRSMDVVLGKSKAFYQKVPQYLSLLGQEPSYNYSMSFDKDEAGKTVRLPYDRYPQDMFQRVFASRILDPATADKFKAKKITIGDLVLQDFRSLLNHRRISSDDKVVVNNFVDQLQSLNTRINAAPSVLTCSRPTMRNVATGYWERMTEQDRFNFFSNYIDTMIAAMACDLTRVCVISMRLFGHDHGLSHAAPGNRENQLKYLENTRKIARIVAEFATKMDAVKEADGKSMLDHSILFWGNEDSNGGPHSCISMPAVSFGSAGEKIKTGYYMDYRQRPFFRHPDGQNIGRSYTQLLVTFMRALGLPPTDYLQYGDGGGFGSFNKNVSYTNGRYIPYEASRNDVLPFIGQV